MEILREKHSEVEKEARDKVAITMAINSLSYSGKRSNWTYLKNLAVQKAY